MALALLFALWLDRRSDEEAEPLDDPASASTDAGEEPPLLVSRGSGDEPQVRREDAPEKEKGAKDTPPKRPALAYLMGLAHKRDDPALPKARVPLIVDVVDRRGKAVPRAIVKGTWGEWHTRGYHTDDEGRTVMQLPPNTRALEVVGQGAPSTGHFGFIHYHPVVPGAATTKVVLRQSMPITGRVTVGGKPPRGGSVKAYRMGRPTFEDGEHKISFYRKAGLVQSVYVKPDGTFALQVPDDAQITLVFCASVVPTMPRAVLPDVTPGSTGIELAATAPERTHTQRVRLLDPAGHPVQGAMVSFTPVGISRIYANKTDADGRIPMDLVRNWLYTVRVAAGSNEHAQWASHESVIAAGDGEHEIRLARAPALIEGTVVDEHGRGMEGAWVAVVRGGEYLALMRAGKEGRFSGSSNAPPGERLHVYARYPMESPTSRGYVENVVAGDPLVIRLEQLGPLSAKDLK